MCGDFAPAAVIAQTPNSLLGAPGDVVTPAPTVIIRDAGGNALANFPVTFEVVAGEGRLTGAAGAVTDAQGVVTASGWVLGLPGTNQLRIIAAPSTFACCRCQPSYCAM